eukprot:1160119-Pelagomonas_calceolata.AAC.11
MPAQISFRGEGSACWVLIRGSITLERCVAIHHEWIATPIPNKWTFPPLMHTLVFELEEVTEVIERTSRQRKLPLHDYQLRRRRHIGSKSHMSSTTLPRKFETENVSGPGGGPEGGWAQATSLHLGPLPLHRGCERKKSLYQPKGHVH